jgi:hypothetical protein
MADVELQRCVVHAHVLLSGIQSFLCVIVEGTGICVFLCCDLVCMLASFLAEKMGCF